MSRRGFNRFSYSFLRTSLSHNFLYVRFIHRYFYSRGGFYSNGELLLWRRRNRCRCRVNRRTVDRRHRLLNMCGIRLGRRVRSRESWFCQYLVGFEIILRWGWADV